MGRMHYLQPDEESIIKSYSELCEHLDDYWTHFCVEADFMKKVLEQNYSSKEKEHLPHIAIHLSRDDKKLRPLVKKLDLNYKDILDYYAAAVYNSKYGDKGAKIKCD